jgi:hypothetical protein
MFRVWRNSLVGIKLEWSYRRPGTIRLLYGVKPFKKCYDPNTLLTETTRNTLNEKIIKKGWKRIRRGGKSAKFCVLITVKSVRKGNQLRKLEQNWRSLSMWQPKQ